MKLSLFSRYQWMLIWREQLHHNG